MADAKEWRRMRGAEMRENARESKRQEDAEETIGALWSI
jgi:hypothetical protein